MICGNYKLDDFKETELNAKKKWKNWCVWFVCLKKDCEFGDKILEEMFFDELLNGMNNCILREKTFSIEWTFTCFVNLCVLQISKKCFFKRWELFTWHSVFFYEVGLMEKPVNEIRLTNSSRPEYYQNNTKKSGKICTFFCVKNNFFEQFLNTLFFKR